MEFGVKDPSDHKPHYIMEPSFIRMKKNNLTYTERERDWL